MDQSKAKSIRSFSDDYHWLSNFWTVPIEVTAFGEPWSFSSTEQLFQASKLDFTDISSTEKRRLFEKVVALKTPGESKGFGRRVPRLDAAAWDLGRDRAMARALKAKFSQHDGLKSKLLELEGYYLEEGNHWGDRYWGVDSRTGKGKNRLGGLLMGLRDRWLNEADWLPAAYIPDYSFGEGSDG